MMHHVGLTFSACMPSPSGLCVATLHGRNATHCVKVALHVHVAIHMNVNTHEFVKGFKNAC